jgi:thiazole biosynthesis enzyme
MMPEKIGALDDIVITRAIVERYFQKLLDHVDVDVAVAGGGPAGLTAAYYLAKEQVKVVVLERQLRIGGGMWGGGMMFNELVVQEEGRGILDEFGVSSTPYQNGYHTADSVEAITTIGSKACQAGAKVFNLISVEDVMIRGERVTGLVLNWTATEVAKLHVDPLTIRAKWVVDATGHPAEVLHIIQRKVGPNLFTSSGKVEGEKPMWAEVGEKTILENTREVYPGVYVTGMAANAAFGGPRMGPIFGGMLLSGQRVAELILSKIKSPAKKKCSV